MSQPSDRGDGLDAWKSEFMRAAIASEPKPRSGWRRNRLLLPVAIVAVGGAAAVATAAVVGESSDPPTLRDGITLGYTELATGEPIKCPDGEALTYTAESIPGGALKEPTPVCSDGSVPAVYTEQRRAFEEWATKQEFGTPLSEGPVFSYEIEK